MSATSSIKSSASMENAKPRRRPRSPPTLFVLGDAKLGKPPKPLVKFETKEKKEKKKICDILVSTSPSSNLKSSLFGGENMAPMALASSMSAASADTTMSTESLPNLSPLSPRLPSGERCPQSPTSIFGFGMKRKLSTACPPTSPDLVAPVFNQTTERRHRLSFIQPQHPPIALPITQDHTHAMTRSGSWNGAITTQEQYREPPPPPLNASPMTTSSINPSPLQSLHILPPRRIESMINLQHNSPISPTQVSPANSTTTTTTNSNNTHTSTPSTGSSLASSTSTSSSASTAPTSVDSFGVGGWSPPSSPTLSAAPRKSSVPTTLPSSLVGPPIPQYPPSSKRMTMQIMPTRSGSGVGSGDSSCQWTASRYEKPNASPFSEAAESPTTTPTASTSPTEQDNPQKFFSVTLPPLDESGQTDVKKPGETKREISEGWSGEWNEDILVVIAKLRLLK